MLTGPAFDAPGIADDTTMNSTQNAMVDAMQGLFCACLRVRAFGLAGDDAGQVVMCLGYPRRDGYEC